MILVPAIALGYSLQQPKKYSSNATLLFEASEFAQGLFGTSATFTPTQQSDPTRDAATNLMLVQQSVISQQTAKALGHGQTESSVRSAVSATSDGQSDLVQVTAVTRSPSLSASMANAYAKAFITYRRNSQSAQIVAAEQQIGQKLSQLTGAARNSPAASELTTRQQDLEIFASLQTGDAQLFQPAQVATSPSAPRPVRNALIGIFAGLLLGIALAILSERIDHRITETEEIERIFGRPLLGAIPYSKAIADHSHMLAELGPREGEAFRLLRTNLRYFNLDSDIRSVLLTSAVSSEGKSTVAMNLGAVAAGPGRRVLLIEADMRRPVLAAWFNLTPATGLSDVLAGQAEWRTAIQQVAPFSDMHVGSTSSRDSWVLDVLTAGPPPPNPTDLIESARMGHLIAAARAEYDLVIIDAPPSLVSDAIHLFRHVEGVIAVTRLGVTRRDRATEFASQLERLRAPLLGVVVNGVKSADNYGSYGYAYGGREETKQAIAWDRVPADDLAAPAPNARSRD